MYVVLVGGGGGGFKQLKNEVYTIKKSTTKM
jgi:hypothetical protein